MTRRLFRSLIITKEPSTRDLHLYVQISAKLSKRDGWARRQNPTVRDVVHVSSRSKMAHACASLPVREMITLDNDAAASHTVHNPARSLSLDSSLVRNTREKADHLDARQLDDN